MVLNHSLIIVFLLNILQSQISISLDTNIREVPLFGIANSSMKYNKYEGSNIEYDFGEAEFEKATECINPHVMTFPSANPCYFDWTTGWALDSAEIVDYINTLALPYTNYHDSTTNGNYFFGMSNEDYDWWRNKGGYWNPVNIDVKDFSNFIQSNNIKGTFSLNMLTSSVETTMDMVRENYAYGVPFEYIELGSEYYLKTKWGEKWDDNIIDNDMYDEGEDFTDDNNNNRFDPGRFEFIYPTPQSFALECNKYIDSLSTILPGNTKYAVTAKNKSSTPRSSDWIRQVLSNINPALIGIETIYLSWHEYLRFEKKEDNAENQDTLNAEQVMAFPQFRHNEMIMGSGMDPQSIEDLEEELNLNIRIWLTESAYRELGHKPWIYKWAQSLVNIQNYSLMLRNPYVEIIMLQALHGYSSTSAINHGHEFPDDFPVYVDQDSCSPYGRTATAFSIYFWNYISEGMTHMQEIKFANANGDHLGVISVDPFAGDSELDNPLSPEVGYAYAYLMGWKLNNTSSGEEKGIIINVADTLKNIQYDSNDPIFNNSNMRCIHITSFNNEDVPSIDQYINGDGDLHYDTTYVVSSMIIPPYSVNLFETYISGCTDVSACNFDPYASVDDGSCIAELDCSGVCGGTDVASFTCPDGNILCSPVDCCPEGDSSSCLGCTDPNNNFYDSSALIDDGSCSDYNFSIVYPNDSQIINSDSELFFQWNTPGFIEGTQVAFKLIVSAIVSDETPEEAIENTSNSIYYYDSNWEELPIVQWPWIETGISLQLNIFYAQLISQASMEEFKCPNEYAWQMYAKNVDGSSQQSSTVKSFVFQPALDECGVCSGNGPADGFDCDGNQLSLFNGLIPEDFSIYSIYPNPFNPVTNIIYGLPEHVNVQIIVYDLSGKQVETLISQFQAPGYHSVNWNADNHPSSVYFVKIVAGDYINTQKLMLVK